MLYYRKKNKERKFSMETKKKEKKYFLGIIGGLILGLLFCALIVSLYIYTDFESDLSQ